jgi:hypothetical protein
MDNQPEQKKSPQLFPPVTVDEQRVKEKQASENKAVWWFTLAGAIILPALVVSGVLLPPSWEQERGIGTIFFGAIVSGAILGRVIGAMYNSFREDLSREE